VERPVRRDVRRFAYFRWRVIEVPQSVPFDPMRVWGERHGFLPPFGLGGIVGYHFRVGEGVRAVRIARPETLQVPDQVRNRLFAVIAAKHRVAVVRLARSGESPALTVADRLPRPRDRQRVEEWPEDDRGRDPLVAELALNGGLYLTGSIGWDNATGSLDQAILFTDVEEAEDYLAALTPTPPVLLRYLAGAISEADQREAAAVEGKAVM
jgi:hypothetical protein